MESEEAVEEVMRQFGFSPDWGFVEESPLEQLGEYFSPWTDLVLELDDIRDEPGTYIREIVSQLPLLDDKRLTSKAELQLAHTLLSCLGQSYVHEEPSHPCASIPPSLAVPWVNISKSLGIPPIIVHSTISLNNWRKTDPEGPFSLPNLTTLYSLESSRDLEVFFLVPLLVELASVPAVKAILTLQALSSLCPVPWPLLPPLLASISRAVGEMRHQLALLPTGCEPTLFYHRLRPLLSGWKDNPALPQGMLYEGVSTSPCHYSGGSAAQSAALQLLDAGLGVEHHDMEGEFLADMRKHYMPPNQSGLIERVLAGPSLSSVCRASPLEEVREGFSSCLEELVSFRTDHLVLVARYRRRPSQCHRRRQVHPWSQGNQPAGGQALAGPGDWGHPSGHLPQEDQGGHQEGRQR